MNFLGIKETCIYMDDLESAKEFYNGVLELPVINYEKGKHVFFQCGRSVLLCFNPEDSKLKVSPPAHFGGGKQHFALEVSNEDYNTVKMKISAKGIKIIDEVTWQADIESFYFEDPEGNVVEVIPEKGIWD